MKILVTAALLLALVFPAEAKARDLSDLRKWQDLDFQCHDAPVADDEELDVEITQKDYDKTRRGKTCLAAKALAAKFRASDRKWQPTMDTYRDLAGECHAAVSADEESDTVCAAAKKLAKKLEAAGYCVYARDGVGRPSRNREHCYIIDHR